MTHDTPGADDMHLERIVHYSRSRRGLRAIASAVVLSLIIGSAGQRTSAEGRLATVKSLRCTFKQSAIGGWTKDGSANPLLKPATLTLRLESIDYESGTAQLKTGSMSSEITAKLSGGYLHFMQIFRTGPLYTTTVFDNAASGTAFKAVHSR